MLGMGGATRYTILRHQGRGEDGDAAFTHTLGLGLALAAALLALGIAASGPIARWLGADGEVFAMSRTYLQVLLLFSPAFLLNDVLLCFVRNDGAPQLSMLAMVAGSLSNVALDYIFIFPLDMGIFGAVLATGLAPVISLAVLSPVSYTHLDVYKRQEGAFARQVLQRYRNPYNRHLLASIAMNSASKFRARLLPPLKGYQARRCV